MVIICSDSLAFVFVHGPKGDTPTHTQGIQTETILLPTAIIARIRGDPRPERPGDPGTSPSQDEDWRLETESESPRASEVEPS